MVSKAFTILCVAIVFATAYAQNTREVATWIESPRYTVWGEWGPEEVCPEGTWVNGFRIKVQPDMGFFVDDTAMNSVELSCTDHSSEQPPTYIKSSEGHLGTWGNYIQCNPGAFATGFELRSEPVTFDNSAANNFAMFCSDNTRHEGNGQVWGDWTGRLNCPRGMEICGIRTQVEAMIPAPADNTALNNVDLGCCPNESKVYF